jgi:hypothetical protein
MRADRPPMESVAAMALDEEFEFRSPVRRGVTRACTEDTAAVYVCLCLRGGRESGEKVKGGGSGSVSGGIREGDSM